MLTLSRFNFSMIPTFRRVSKLRYHVDRHTNIDNILDYLRPLNLERGAIAKIARDPGIPEPFFVPGIATWL
jgi:hypothetical protein